jgi:hypothetical protein
MEEYNFIRLAENNIKDLHKLFSTKAKNPGGLERFIGKYDTKYTRAANIGYFAYDRNGAPAAFYGVIPCFAIADKKRILIAQAVDAITHPDHRRKGLFEKIVALSTELSESEGIHFIYGVPNDLSYQGFIKKFNWSQSHSLLKFQFRTHQLPASYFFRKYACLNKMYLFYVKTVLGFLTKGDQFENSGSGDENIYLVRDANYFHYKNYRRKYLVKISGLSVWLGIDGSMKIGDLEKSNSVNVRKVVNQLKRLAFILGISKVVFQFSPNSFWASKFIREFKAETALPIIYYNVTNIYDPTKLILTYGDIDTF